MCAKGESEPNIKYSLGKAVGLVRRFITIQNFGHNWRRTDGIRVEYFVRIHSIAARPRSPTVPCTKWATQYNSKDELFFMSMFNDIIWWSKDNETECIANATLVSNYKKISSKTLVHSSDQKQSGILHTSIDHGGEWDKVAELTMIKFGEGGHPVFRATSPLSRGTLKCQGGGKLSIHFCANGDTNQTFSHNCFW